MFAAFCTLFVACTLIMVGFHYLIPLKKQVINSFCNYWIDSLFHTETKDSDQVNVSHESRLTLKRNKREEINWVRYVLFVTDWKN